MSIAAVLLAAGRGSRLGGNTPKALVSLGNQALLSRTLAEYLASSLDYVVVVLGYGAEQVEPILPSHPRLRAVRSPEWEKGMSASIRAGMEALDPDTESVLIGLGDMPWVPSAILDQVRDAARGRERIVAPYFRGGRGHPVSFPRCLFEPLKALQGDRGAASLLETYRDLLFPLAVEEPGILRDLDFVKDIPAPLPRVVIRGGGDLATGVAHRLYVSGFPVLILELAEPRMLRATVSFAEAVYAGEISVEGVLARRYEDPPGDWRSAVPVVVDPQGALIDALRPEVLIDARMLKVAQNIDLERAPFVLGLGPGLTAGRDCHAVIETERGHSLGKVILAGPAAPDTGVPGVLGGEGERRVVRAPVAGRFTSLCHIGEPVEAGQQLGSVDGEPVLALIAGQVRGLIHSGLEVRAREKIGDVDPRSRIDLQIISDKARAVGGGALEAVMRWHCGGLQVSEKIGKP